MVQRLVYRSRHSYATKSNKHPIVKTPGGRLVYTRNDFSLCCDPSQRIQRIPPQRPSQYKRPGSAVRERIIRAFLVEEKRIVKKLLKLQKAKEKAAPKA